MKDLKLLNSTRLKICIISFGPIESKGNGYFIRVWNILRELSKLSKILVLEFPETYVKNKIKKVGNVIFVRLRGNEITSSRISNVMKKFFTFDPLHNLKFQILSFIELWKHRKYLSLADVVMIEGCLIPAGNIIAKLLRKKIILDTHCINKLLAMSYRKRRLLPYLLRTYLWDVLERLTIRLSDIVIAVSKKEKEYIIKKYGMYKSKVLVIPNVIEPPKNISKEVIKGLREKFNLKNKIVVTFVGNLESVQNADAVDYIINELAPWFWKKKRDVIFLIIGKGKNRFKCDLPNVIFTGFVKNLSQYLALSDIFIAPLRVGAGTKTKIIEYLAYGKSIVTTPIGTEGLESFISRDIVHSCPIQMFKRALFEVIRKNTNLNLRKNHLKHLSDEFKSNITKLMLKVTS